MIEAVVVAVDIRNGFKQFGKQRNLNNIIVVKLNPNRNASMVTKYISE